MTYHSTNVFQNRFNLSTCPRNGTINRLFETCRWSTRKEISFRIIFSSVCTDVLSVTVVGVDFQVKIPFQMINHISPRSSSNTRSRVNWYFGSSSLQEFVCFLHFFPSLIGQELLLLQYYIYYYYILGINSGILALYLACKSMRGRTED